MPIIKNIRQSISLKLSLVNLLLCVVIFVVSMGILFQRSIYIMHQEAVEHATCALNATQLRVSQYVNEIEAATDYSDWLVKKYFRPDSLLNFTRRIVELNPNVSGCSITAEPDAFPDSDRSFSAYSVRMPDSIATEREGPYDYYNMVWYKTPRELGKPCWVDPFDDFNEGTLSASEKIASYCKPLYDSDGRLMGVISTDLSLSNLSRVVTAVRPYPNSYFVMLGKDGRFFIHPEMSKLCSKSVLDNPNPEVVALGQNMLAGKQGYQKVHLFGHSCIVCYKQVPGTPWSIALVSPESDIFSKYLQLVYFIIPLMLVGLLLITLFTHSLISYAIKPLNRLAEQSLYIAAGHYDKIMPRSRRPDAVGRLQNSFVTMQKSLAQHISNIQRINDETALHNKELAEANRQAQEGAKQKMAFIQDMTHQIRTPLNIIMGFSEVLHNEGAQMPVEEVRGLTGLIDRNTVTLGRMIAMLYDSSDAGTVKLRLDDDVSVNEVAQEAVKDSMRQYSRLRVDFTTDLPDSFCIRSNHLYIFRSLRELFYNSAKYSYGEYAKLHITATDTIVRFVFEDRGPGIAEKDIDKLFLPFNKTDGLSEGLGLGLPLTRRHARNLGGDLYLDADYKEGCRFILELPNNSHLCR